LFPFQVSINPITRSSVLVWWALCSWGLGLGENSGCLRGSSRVIKGNVRLPAKDGETVVYDTCL